jgi:PAS domain S-box-containing protein
VAGDGTVLYSNEAGEPLLNEWCAEKGGKLPSSIGDIVQRVISRNSPEKIEVKVEKRVYLVVFHPLPEEQRVNISGFDISEQKGFEEKLLENEEKYRNIVETSNEGIYLVNEQAIITYANETMELSGYTVEEIVGRPIWDFISEESKPVAKRNFEKRQQGVNDSYELKLIRKDGSFIWGCVSAKSLFNKEGKFTGYLAMLTDITERKKAEEKLQESEQKYRNIVETANEGILITDSESTITYANNKAVDTIGYAPEEVIGRPIWSFISEEYRPIVKKNLEKRKQGMSESYELKLKHKDGSSIWAFLNTKPLFDKDDNFMGVMSLLTDITKRKEAEEALTNIETARKKEIHHRIKNNLQVISSLLDLQAEQFRNRENIKDSEVLDAFRESQDRVISMALIHEELYKGGGFETLNFSPYIHELAENLILTYRLGNTDITLCNDLEESLLLNMDTAVPLGIIVNELVSNSLKHAFPDRNKGKIRIKLSREQNGENIESITEDCKSTSFTLTVSDDGVGIPENLNVEKLDSLGFQLVTSLIDQLGGEFELRRSNGTKFTMKFTVTEKK